jgi:4,5-DOPA dioxygenase extradiol
MAMETAPVLFVSHGAPTFALEPGVLGPKLADIGAHVGEAKAILVISPHWQTRGVSVMTTAIPETIHDFGGFPQPLYDIRYETAGHPQVAEQAARALSDAGFGVYLDDRRGLDHGAWVPLRYLSPTGWIPVFQVSMPFTLDAAGALRLGSALAPLREEGVLILGSGSLTHNLREFRQDSNLEAPYAGEFVRWVRDALASRDDRLLLAYRRQAPHAERAHPTEEHFLPLLAAFGASSEDDIMTVIDGGITHGALSMESYGWGLPPLTARRKAS